MFRATRINKNTHEIIEYIDANENEYTYEELEQLSKNHELFCENYDLGCHSLVTFINNGKRGIRNCFRTLSKHNENCIHRIKPQKLRQDILDDFQLFLKKLDEDELNLEVTQKSFQKQETHRNNQEKYFHLKKISQLLDAILHGYIFFNDVINNKYLYTYFQCDDDLTRNIRLNKLGYKYYILNAEIANSGNLYISGKNDTRIFINLKDKVQYKKKTRVSLIVLLSPSDFKKEYIKDNNHVITYKTHCLSSQRIFYLKYNKTNRIEKLKQLLSQMPYFLINPFQNDKEVALVPYFSDMLANEFYDYIHNDKIKDPINYILKCTEAEDRKKLLGLDFTFSIFSSETFQYDDSILNINKENISNSDFIPLHYECHVKFYNIKSLIKAMELVKKKKYIPAMLSYHKNENDDMYGSIIFSCVVTDYDSVYIKIQDSPTMKDYEKEITQFYEETQIERMIAKDSVHSIIDYDRIKDLKIFNVGHGECSVCTLLDKKGQEYRLFLDYGLSFFPDDLNQAHIQDAQNEIQSLKVDALILSHWDVDHIAFFTKYHSITSATKFIVPNLNEFNDKEKSALAIRVFKILCRFYALNTTVITTAMTGHIIYDDGHIQISVGQFKSSSHGTPPKTSGYKYRVTRMNNFGLITKINNNKKVLIPGDCDYKMMNTAIISDTYDILLVSHHGAHTGEPPQGNKDAKAIICCSHHYNEPKDETKAHLNLKGYDNKNIIIFKYNKFSKITYSL